MNFEDIIIVLSRPSEAGNTGAVCRVMKNMNLSRLRLVSPEFFSQEEIAYPETELPYDKNEAVIRSRAVHAVEIWEKSETFKTLAEAISGCSLVIGTTRRRGRHRKQVSMNPRDTALFLKNHPGPAALIFGNERTGLNDDELDLCNFASHIPSNENFPSLNLSHAVMIYAWEIFCAFNTEENETVKGQWVPLDQKKIDTTVDAIMENLKILGFYKQQGREEQKRFFRDIFSRAAITERESRYFSEIISKAVWLALKMRNEPPQDKT